MHSVSAGFSLVQSHLRSPELSEGEDWHCHQLPFLSRSSVRAKPHVGHVVVTQLLLGLSRHCRREFAQRHTLENPAELMLALRSCVLLCGFVGLLISRKLWVEGMWDGYELFAEGSRWLISPVQAWHIWEKYKRYANTSLCCRPGVLGKQNSWWRTCYLGKKVWPKESSSLRIIGNILQLPLTEPTETVSSGCIRKKEAA